MSQPCSVKYSRQLRSSGETVTFDAYNSLALRYPERYPTEEYWTNGTTTLLQLRMASNATESTSPILMTASSDPKQRIALHKQKASNTGNSGGSRAIRNSLLAGSIAGITSTALCHPFDVIRTKMQSVALETATATSTTTSNSSAVSYRASLYHHSPMSSFVHTFENGGMRAFYTGLSFPLAAQAVYKATVFCVNNIFTEALKEWKTQEKRKIGNFEPYQLSNMDKFMCGAAGGALNAFCFVTPVEYIRNNLIIRETQLAAAKSRTATAAAKGPIDIIQKTWQGKKGIKGLWRGAGITVARDSLGCGFYFVTFAQFQKLLKNNDADKPSLATTMVSGAAAGLAFWCVALPLDTLKTLVQHGASKTAKSAFQEILQQSENNAIRASKQVCKGWQVALGRGLPSAAVTLATYDYCYRRLEKSSFER
jgi:solute carrier family 25 carnitine/acylcarnitine transporter 20/29